MSMCDLYLDTSLSGDDILKITLNKILLSDDILLYKRFRNSVYILEELNANCELIRPDIRYVLNEIKMLEITKNLNSNHFFVVAYYKAFVIYK